MKTRDLILTLTTCTASFMFGACGSATAIEYPNNDWNIVMLDGTRSIAESLDSVSAGCLYASFRSVQSTLSTDSIAEIGRTTGSREVTGAVVGGIAGFVVAYLLADAGEPRQRRFDLLNTSKWGTTATGVLGGVVGASIGHEIGKHAGGTVRHDCRTWSPKSREWRFKQLTGQR